MWSTSCKVLGWSTTPLAKEFTFDRLWMLAPHSQTVTGENTVISSLSTMNRYVLNIIEYNKHVTLL